MNARADGLTHHDRPPISYTVFLHVLYYLPAAALRCRECAYFRGESEDPGVGSVLERMNAGSKDICKDDPDRAGSLDCSEMTLREGYDEWRCVHRDNVMTAELNGNNHE